MASSGQTINDRLNAAKYTLSGQSLALCVCKATTEEIISPKKKHLDYLLACTHISNVSIPQLATMLIDRTNQTRWVVVYKALITVHHLMSFGNESFTQYLASSNYSFQLGNFLDRLDYKSYDMSTFIRKYSRYINSKALSYRTLAIDLCRIRRGEDNKIRSMPAERLLKAIPVIQSQMDALLEFQCSPTELNNGVMNASFILLFKDLIKLFATYNDAIINLLEIYFQLNKKMCREAFELYKKFLVRVDKVSDFLKLAETVGIDRGEIPDLRRAPSSLVDALEQHLMTVEGSKRTSQPAKSMNPFSTKFIEEESSKFPEDSSKFPQESIKLPEGSIKFPEESTKFPEDPIKFPEDPIKFPGESSSVNLVENGFSAFGGLSIHFSELSDFGDNNATTKTSTVEEFDRKKEFEEAFGDSVGTSVSFTMEPAQQASDIAPPGYSGGLLLKPETIVRPQINPSIDPQTQYQLLQIQREQAESRQSMRQNDTRNSNKSTLNTRPVSSLDKRMSAFEDLELVMRQTFKSEKT